MDKAHELMSITRRVLGERPGSSFYTTIGMLLTEGGGTNSSLVLATKKIELMVKLFVGVDKARLLTLQYKDFFRKNPSYL